MALHGAFRMDLPENTDDGAFAEEVARIQASGVLGESGRLLELFNYLAARGSQAGSASQAEIAEAVFGHTDSASDDTTARVYVHRLRKRLDDFYAAGGSGEGLARLHLPSGVYALRLSPTNESKVQSASPLGVRRIAYLLVIPLVLLAAAAGLWVSRPASAPDTDNALWRPLLESDRPIVIVLGDYYIFGEYSPRYPEIGRLVRDFAVNSPTDLARLQESEPSRYAQTEDMGLNYLPLSSAYGLSAVMPILARHPRPVSVMPASQLSSETFRDYNIVYIGLVSGMGLLEDVTFDGSNYRVGTSYDELIEVNSGTTFHSEEAFSLASRRYYKDYGYLSVFDEPGGAKVVVVAGARDTGLRGMAALLSGTDLPSELAEVADGGGDRAFEAVVEIVGQQGTDLSHRLVAAKERRDARQNR